MGCIEFRFKSSVEKSIIEAEDALGFSLIKVRVIDLTMRKYSHSEKINPLQLQKIATILKIHILDYDKYTGIQSTLNKLQAETNKSNLRDLLVIGILLGQGTLTEKANLMFQVFDVTLEETIEITRLQGQVLKVISDHSINTFSSLVTPTQISEND